MTIDKQSNGRRIEVESYIVVTTALEFAADVGGNQFSLTQPNSTHGWTQPMSVVYVWFAHLYAPPT